MIARDAKVLASELASNRIWQVETIYRRDDTADSCRVMLQLREWPQLRTVLADVSDALPSELAEAREILLAGAEQLCMVPGTSTVLTTGPEGEDSPPLGWQP